MFSIVVFPLLSSSLDIKVHLLLPLSCSCHSFALHLYEFLIIHRYTRLAMVFQKYPKPTGIADHAKQIPKIL